MSARTASAPADLRANPKGRPAEVRAAREGHGRCEGPVARATGEPGCAPRSTTHGASIGKGGGAMGHSSPRRCDGGVFCATVGERFCGRHPAGRRGRHLRELDGESERRAAEVRRPPRVLRCERDGVRPGVLQPPGRREPLRRVRHPVSRRQSLRARPLRGAPLHERPGYLRRRLLRPHRPDAVRERCVPADLRPRAAPLRGRLLPARSALQRRWRLRRRVRARRREDPAQSVTAVAHVSRSRPSPCRRPRGRSR